MIGSMTVGDLALQSQIQKGQPRDLKHVRSRHANGGAVNGTQTFKGI